MLGAKFVTLKLNRQLHHMYLFTYLAVAPVDARVGRYTNDTSGHNTCAVICCHN